MSQKLEFIEDYLPRNKAISHATKNSRETKLLQDNAKVPKISNTTKSTNISMHLAVITTCKMFPRQISLKEMSITESTNFTFSVCLYQFCNLQFRSFQLRTSIPLKIKSFSTFHIWQKFLRDGKIHIINT